MNTALHVPQLTCLFILHHSDHQFHTCELSLFRYVFAISFTLWTPPYTYSSLRAYLYYIIVIISFSHFFLWTNSRVPFRIAAYQIALSSNRTLNSLQVYQARFNHTSIDWSTKNKVSGKHSFLLPQYYIYSTVSTAFPMNQESSTLN